MHKISHQGAHAKRKGSH